MILLGAGKGLRMENDIPKQFLPLLGKPILMRTIERVNQALEGINIILVLPKDFIGYWNLLCREYSFKIKHSVVEGGQQRFFSVKNALDTITNDNAIVGVHDGVRPLVSVDLIRNSFFRAANNENIVSAVNPYETIRVSNTDNNSETTTLDRNKVWLVQTPQCFNIKVLREAYSQDYQAKFTDDSSVVESLGYEISLIQGSRENIKITNKIDFALAELLLEEIRDNGIRD
jgi:2-C-methyl-D-erythritol 4-phosphate cytidylyltransferase